MLPVHYLQTCSALSRGKLADVLRDMSTQYGGNAPAALDGMTLRRWAQTPERMPRWARLATFELAVANGYEARSEIEQSHAVRAFRTLRPGASFADLVAYSPTLFGTVAEADVRAVWLADVHAHGA